MVQLSQRREDGCPESARVVNITRGQTLPHLEVSVTNPSRLCREGLDMDFFRASVPGSLGDLVGHGVRGTYPEAGCCGQDTPRSGDLPFFVRPPNRFLIVVPD